MAFTVFPAIDLRRGRCVRLQQGDAATETVFSEDPEEMARHWQKLGAQWLHVINLDGALETPDVWDGPNGDALRCVLRSVTIPMQVGGGIRTLDSVARLLSLGAARVILGTAAVSQPDLLEAALDRYGEESILAALDARKGKVATHGWRTQSSIDVYELGARMRQMGVRTALHTDVSRDGTLVGANVRVSVELAQRTGLRVIVAGGVASLADVAAAAKHAGDGIAGVVIGQALYRGAVRLPEALAEAAAILGQQHQRGAKRC